MVRIGDLQAPGRTPVDPAVQHDLLPRREDVLEERLVQEGDAHAARRVLNEHLEDAGTPAGEWYADRSSTPCR